SVREHRQSDVALTPSDPGQLVTLEEIERRYIMRVMDAVGGHRSRAARVLGLDRKTLYRKLARLAARVGDVQSGRRGRRARSTRRDRDGRGHNAPKPRVPRIPGPGNHVVPAARLLLSTPRGPRMAPHKQL